jgi:hypothetical protein
LRNRPTARLVDWSADVDGIILVVIERAGDPGVAHRAAWCATDLRPAAGLPYFLHGALAKGSGG